MRERLWSPVFVIIVACSLCCFLVGQGSNAGTSVYLDRIGSSAGLAGIGALTFSLAAALSRIASGPLSDSRGRAFVMVIGSCIMLAGALGPLLSNADALFIVWRALQGFGFAAATTAAATAAADVLPLSRLGEGIGYYGLGQAISMSVGPALAIFLISTDPPENFYIGLTVCAVLAIALSLACRYEKHPQDLPATAEYRIRWEKGQVGKSDKKNGRLTLRSLADSIFEPTALAGTIPIMFIATSFGFGIFFMGVYGKSIGVSNPGLFYTVSAVSMIAIRLTSGKFMDKVCPIAIMGAAVVFGLICYGIVLACSQLEMPSMEWIFYVAGIFYGMSLGIALPVNQTVAVRLSPPERWGAANGLFLLGNDIAIGAASLAWGILSESVGFPVTIIVILVLIAASFIAAIRCYPKE